MAGSNVFGPTTVNQECPLTISLKVAKNGLAPTLPCPVLRSVAHYTRKQRGGRGHAVQRPFLPSTVLRSISLRYVIILRVPLDCHLQLLFLMFVVPLWGRGGGVHVTELLK